jgi:hypothetical protein
MYDIVIVHGPSDDYTLPQVVSQIKKNVVDKRNIYIISYDASSDLFEDIVFRDCIVIDEKVFPFSKKDVNGYIQTDSRNGWYLQQLLKLYCSFVVKDMLDDYVIVDADTLFLKPISFKYNDKYLFNMASEYHTPYFEHMKRLHPSLRRVHEKVSGVAHHMIFNREYIKELFKLVEDNHGGKPFWNVFLEQVDVSMRPYSGASEYEIYINFMLEYHKDKVIPRKLRFENTGAPVEHVLTYMVNTDIAYASLHAWMSNRQPVKREGKRLNLISGENFQMLCDLTVITREIERFHTSLPNTVKRVYLDGEIDVKILNESKSIFVYTHILEDFISKVLPLIKGRFVLMTHNSDHSVNTSHLPLLDDERLIHMFSQNTFVTHEKLTALPIGIANSMWAHGQKSSIEHLLRVKTPFNERVEKIYVNVNEGTNYNHRSGVVASLRSNPLSVFSPSNKPHHMYLEEMSKYKWVASPKGNGIDCHRLWECMYAGCIAICDDSVNARAFKEMGLPIILVGEGSEHIVPWNNISLEWLQEQTSLLNPFKVHKQLDLNWWKEQINSYCEGERESEEGCFVLVYLGVLRDYTRDCIRQIRLWNKTKNIYLCINNNRENERVLDMIKEFNVKVVYVEDLEMTSYHKEFSQRYGNMANGGLWKYSMERFFVIEEVMKKYKLRNIFHLEVDNLIYFKSDELLEKCKKINKILIPSDSERRYIAGMCFINNYEGLIKLNNFFKDRCINSDEMHSIMNYSRICDDVETFPTLPPGDNMRVIYEDRRGYINDIQRLSKYVSEVNLTADAAAIGQYFFGVDPIHHKAGQNSSDGFVNRDSIFAVDRIFFKWNKVDGLQRLTMSVDKENWYQVCNLHVHNKNLKRGMSDIEEMEKHLSNIL